MTVVKIIRSDWDPKEKLLITQLTGDVDISDIEQWEHSLYDALDQVEDNGVFKIFININGFKAIHMDAHKRFRNIVPATLANYGWKVGYVNLFEEASGMALTNTRGIRCTAAAHTHQDASKIGEYEKRFGRDRERFFANTDQAKEWIMNLPVID